MYWKIQLQAKSYKLKAASCYYGLAAIRKIKARRLFTVNSCIGPCLATYRRCAITNSGL